MEESKLIEYTKIQYEDIVIPVFVKSNIKDNSDAESCPNNISSKDSLEFNTEKSSISKLNLFN